jgi:hypothetical protein
LSIGRLHVVWQKLEGFM